MIQVKCISCKKEVIEKDYNLDTKIAYCIACDTMFNFDPLLSISHDTSYKKIEKPKGIEINETQRGPEIQIYHKKTHHPLGSVLFGLFFIIIPSIAWYNMSSQHSSPWQAILLFMLFASIGVGMIYKAIKQFTTITTFSLLKNTLEISVKSKFTKPKTKYEIQKSSIDQVFVRKRVIENENSTSSIYDLGIAQNDGSVKYVLQNYPKSSYLLFLETTLENFLDIQDAPHSEEMKNLGLVPKNFSEAIKVAKYMYKNR